MSKTVVTLPGEYSFEYSKILNFENNVKIRSSYCSDYVLKTILLACTGYLSKLNIYIYTSIFINQKELLSERYKKIDERRKLLPYNIILYNIML